MCRGQVRGWHVHSASITLPARTDSNRRSPLRTRLPCPLDYGPWRRGTESSRQPVSFAGRRPRQREPRHSAPARSRTGQPSFGGTAENPLPGARVRREGLEPPCGMPGLQPGAVAAAPPTLGVAEGTRTLYARIHGPGPRPLWIRPPCSAEGSNLQPPGCGPSALTIELAELERVQEESNPHSEIRSLVPCPLDDGRLSTRSTSRTCPSRLSSWCSAAELCGREAGPTGLEPATSALTGQRSDHLS